MICQQCGALVARLEEITDDIETWWVCGECALDYEDYTEIGHTFTLVLTQGTE